MPFDSTTRNKLQRMVGACRRLLTDEFDEQLQGLYGIYAQDGRVLELEKLTTLDDDDYQIATLLRDRVKHLSSGMASEKQPLAEAVRRVLREQAFTVLNRFAALRMAEERGFVQECVGQGLKSKGFQVFETVARSGLGGAYERYVTFIHGMFDELSLDLGVLFDRWSPFGLLFPREPTLLKFFDLLNDPELKPLWKEDETIGWIYQYFNDEAERKKMREESSAPRNSRELAVRNQFFTPRYVVEFLTDNTLGRIWYEMTRAETKLKEQCRYLVRRPNENFLKPGENPPATNTPDAAKDSPSPPSEGGEGRGEVGSSPLSTLNPQPSTAPTQEELLRQPVHIPHRPLKDPRTILMLDPACGSMHFGLYAFDLFEVIYEEAWEMAERLKAECVAERLKAEGQMLKEDKGDDGWEAEFQQRYPLFASFVLPSSDAFSLQPLAFSLSKEDFLRQVPRLIIEHNLHGIDIDPRCAQIAGLSLWLRAHKAWQRLGLKPAERPAIKRSNIVCAESMPGEKELLREFVEREFPAEERGVVLRLLETIFDKMQLAGEAGSLLKIEEEIRSAIEDARRQWQTARQRPEFFDAAQLATLDKRVGAQQELAAAERASMAADLRSLTSEDFWLRVEERIYAALRDYAEQAEDGDGFQRRLFADDAARGFAFIDVCRKRYDVTVMNPPFGESALSTKDYFAGAYPRTKNDLYAAFVDRWLSQLSEAGRIGAITSRLGFFNISLRDWRTDILLGSGTPLLLADLGYGVLDNATVETAAYVLEAHRSSSGMLCFQLLTLEDKGEDLAISISSLADSKTTGQLFIVNPDTFRHFPGAPFCYWPSLAVQAVFQRLPLFESKERNVRCGMGTLDDFRFIRCWWEVCAGTIAHCSAETARTTAYVPYAKGGSASPFWSPLSLVVRYTNEGREVKSFVEHKVGSASRKIQSQGFYFKAGLTFGRRIRRLAPACLPAGAIFSDGSNAVFFPAADEQTVWNYLGLLNTRSVRALFTMCAPVRKMEVGYLQRMPVPDLQVADAMLAQLARDGYRIASTAARSDSLDSLFDSPFPSRGDIYSIKQLRRTIELNKHNTLLELNRLEGELEIIARRAFGLTEADVTTATPPTAAVAAHDLVEAKGDDDNEGGSGSTTDLDDVVISHHLIEYSLGCAFGRWDIRYATGERAAPELPDPFAPLPVCPPGQLQNAQGLPAGPEDMPAAYPVRIPWDGILVDDPNHPLDIERRVREVIEVIWKDRAEAIEHEASEILGVKSLRDYFRKPAGFFADHLKRYSKSRRQAPIYWPLSTASGSYTLWIYYHRLTDQTLFQCVNDFVKPKLEEVNRDVERLKAEGQRLNGGTAKLREQIEELQDFAIELREVHDELLRVAGLPYKPNLNDGVLITAGPLWKLFRLPKWRKDLKACWEALEKGEYEWAHLAYSIWPDRVKQVCKTDRSIAIAHGLEDLCDVKAPEKKAKRGKKKKDQMELEAD